METQVELKEPKTNLPKVLAEIEAIKTEVGDLAIKMAANKVQTEEDYSLAAFQGKQAAEAVKKFERKRDEIIAPAKSFLERVRDTVKAITTSINEPKEALRERMEAFNRKKREAQAKEAAKLAAKQAELDKKILEADTAKEQEKLLEKSAKIEVKKEAVLSEKPQNASKRRVFSVVDEKLVPREFLMVNEKAIRAVMGRVGDPFPNIAGVKFEDSEEVRFS